MSPDHSDLNVIFFFLYFSGSSDNTAQLLFKLHQFVINQEYIIDLQSIRSVSSEWSV